MSGRTLETHGRRVGPRHVVAIVLSFSVTGACGVVWGLPGGIAAMVVIWAGCWIAYRRGRRVGGTLGGIVLASLVRTGSGCPAEWSAWDTGGAYYYIRYRHGWLTVDRAEDEAAWWHDDHEVLFEQRVGGRFDGFMEAAEMLSHTGLRFTGDVSLVGAS